MTWTINKKVKINGINVKFHKESMSLIYNEFDSLKLKFIDQDYPVYILIPSDIKKLELNFFFFILIRIKIDKIVAVQ